MVRVFGLDIVINRFLKVVINRTMCKIRFVKNMVTMKRRVILYFVNPGSNFGFILIPKSRLMSGAFIGVMVKYITNERLEVIMHPNACG